VVVTVSQLKDPASLQTALRAEGIPAAVRFQAAGKMSLTPPLPRVRQHRAVERRQRQPAGEDPVAADSARQLAQNRAEYL
jgi:hypothetical protein